ncbi:MAG: hypothetical protein PHQ86_05585 [Dehalococcoidales bacterium]|nr:hypothetical protein [Dehalococcoidales bacterium]
MIFQTIIAARIIFIFSLINFVTAFLVLLSCRCIPGLKITGDLMQYSIYRRLFGYHCYYWRAFWISVVIHAIFAIGFIGVPF